MRYRWLSASAVCLPLLACGSEGSSDAAALTAGSRTGGTGGSGAARGSSGGDSSGQSDRAGSGGSPGQSGGGAQGSGRGGSSNNGGSNAGGATSGAGGRLGSPAGNGSGGAPPIGEPSAGEGGSSEGDAGGGSTSASGCPFSGHVTYKLNQPATWPADLVPRITKAMDEATRYYNCYADLTKSITVNYKAGVPTAEANVDGQLSFGSNTGYMQVATAMHEVGHTLGVGYSPWLELTNDGRWIGPNVDAFMKALPKSERDPDAYSQRDYITADRQHFWPYGLNQADEHQSEWSLINHVRIVASMQLDKQAYRNGEL